MVPATSPKVNIIGSCGCLAQADACADERLAVECELVPRCTAVNTFIKFHGTLLLNGNIAHIGVLYRIFYIEYHTAEHPVPRLSAVCRTPQLCAVTGKDYIVISRVEIGHARTCICSLLGGDVLPVLATVIAYPEDATSTHQHAVWV